MTSTLNAMTEKCWTCDERVASHSVYRDALGEYEKTCDECFHNEYPEDEEGGKPSDKSNKDEFTEAKVYV